MNTWKELPNGCVQPGGRGFYVERREDHLVPAFFEDFALFPDLKWLERIAEALEISIKGRIRAAAWAYSYEEILPGEHRPRIADITIMWRDHDGDAVLVIEAKKPGFSMGILSAKDDPAQCYYIQYRAFAAIRRRYQALLVDDLDFSKLPTAVRALSGVLTWHDLAAIKVEMINEIAAGSAVRDMLKQRLCLHHTTLGLQKLDQHDVNATGTQAAYTAIRQLPAPQSVTDWLIGSELFFAVRKCDAVADLPYPWLATERSATEWRAGKFQTTTARQRRIWHL